MRAPLPGGEVAGRLTAFVAPRSYTGEDVLELAVPGSPPLLAALLRRFLAADDSVGADPPWPPLRLAGPGEFTLRAFLNGKLDLTQAEAVARLIHASGEEEARAAYRQVGGDLRHEIEAIEAEITATLALVEAGLDFPDEDLPEIAPEKLAGRLEPVRDSVRSLLRHTALRIPDRGSLRIALVGLPNAGKSSLLNAVVRRDAALVSPLAGTTRDPVRALGSHGGKQLEWVDLAGLEAATWTLEETGDPWPRGPDGEEDRDVIGRLSRRELECADRVVWVVDGTVEGRETALSSSRPASPSSPTRRVLVVSKCDLLDLEGRRAWKWLAPAAVLVSSRTGEGLESLLERLVTSGVDPAEEEGPRPGRGQEARWLVSPLQEARLERCGAALERACEDLLGHRGSELVAVNLREALLELAPLSGREVSRRVLGAIFGQFCIGK